MVNILTLQYKPATEPHTGYLRRSHNLVSGDRQGPARRNRGARQTRFCISTFSCAAGPPKSVPRRGEMDGSWLDLQFDRWRLTLLLSLRLRGLGELWGRAFVQGRLPREDWSRPHGEPRNSR
jgi:hypothetical protein